MESMTDDMCGLRSNNGIENQAMEVAHQAVVQPTAGVPNVSEYNIGSFVPYA